MIWTINWVIKTFINFNIFRSAAFIPRRMLETSISRQLARSIDAQINAVSKFVTSFDKNEPSGRPYTYNDKRTIDNAFSTVQRQLEVLDRLESERNPKIYSKRKQQFHLVLRAWMRSLMGLKIKQKGNNYFVKNLGDVLKQTIKNWSI